jgi:hypothetical protein
VVARDLQRHTVNALERDSHVEWAGVKGMSFGTRYVLPLGVVAFAFYLVLADFGVSAGLIHRGVRVATVDLGGLTESQAAGLLERRATELRDAPIVFKAPGVSFVLDPKEVDWQPQADRSARAAMAVGRAGGAFQALADRFRGWFGGVKLDWYGAPNGFKVGRFIDRVEGRARALGYGLRRYKLRRKIRRGLNTWPRRPLRIPVVERP